jgi:SOS response regulatory protein OraA/RecX
MLSRRPYSRAELRRSLERKFPGQSTAITESIARLRELGFVNDAQYAEQVAQSFARRRLGRIRSRRELKSKLVDYRVIEPAIERAYDGVDERQLLEQTLDKKIQALRKPLTRAKFASLCQSLLRRGFRAEDIMKAIRARTELRLVSEGVNPAGMEEESEEKL